MYHEIPSSSNEAAYYGVPRARFAAHLDRLTGTGLSGTTLERQRAGDPTGGVAITFDDGHSTHYTDAFPELTRRGMHATFFVITTRVGSPGYVTWAQLAEMAAAGMSIQSHTATHPLLSELSDDEVRRELVTSKQQLDDELRQHTVGLALPGGDAPRGAGARRWRPFVDAGYAWVATSAWGPNVGTHLVVSRYTVRRGTPDARVAACSRAESPALSPEGLRLAMLSKVRRAVGANRYARWRRAVLSLVQSTQRARQA